MDAKRLDLFIVLRKGWGEQRTMPKEGEEGTGQCFAVVVSPWLLYLTRVKHLWA